MVEIENCLGIIKAIKEAEKLYKDGLALDNQEKYSEAIEKYKAAIKKDNDNFLYKENLEKVQIKEQAQQNDSTNNKIITNIFNETVYGKTLLNHPKLLQAAVNNNLSSDLIYEAINNNDEELILAGLISVGYDVGTIN
ncbi:MAG TPA: hypothetical protein LFV92_00190 [Rickettsia endosymbiont of Ceroptres masudai]|nr:hypothetical protein [Rickettsia endosymbiont of Ceroptres masudai]